MPGLHEPRLICWYNRLPLKPWYLSGQVEVCCWMSAPRPQMGGRATDRRLCPVSDGGLGLVTGIRFWSVGPPHPPVVTPTLARWEAGMEGLIGCLDGSVGCLQWQRTHKDLADHTHLVHGLPRAVTVLHLWQPLLWPLYPRALVILSFFLPLSLRRPHLECEEFSRTWLAFAGHVAVCYRWAARDADPAVTAPRATQTGPDLSPLCTHKHLTVLHSLLTARSVKNSFGSTCVFVFNDVEGSRFLLDLQKQFLLIGALHLLRWENVCWLATLGKRMLMNVHGWTVVTRSRGSITMKVCTHERETNEYFCFFCRKKK